MKPQKKLNIISDLATELGTNSYSIENYMMLYDNYDNEKPLQKLYGKSLSKIEQMIHILITNGQITINANGEESIIQRKEYIVITPGSILELKDASHDLKFQMFIFYPELTNDAFLDLGLNYNLMSLTHIFKHKICDDDTFKYKTELYNELKQELRRPQYKFQKLFARSITNLVFINNINFFNIDVAHSGKKMSKQINIYNGFLNLLNEYSTTNREVQFYAEKLGITPKYLSAVTIEYSGKNASCWIDEYVITKAKNLLREQSHNIKDVSEQLNFPSQSFFGRYFKRITGMSPKQFLNAQYANKEMASLQK